MKPCTIEGAPDLPVEVLSPSTQSKDRVKKKLKHAEVGTAHLWFIDSRDVLLEEWVLDAATKTYLEGAMLGGREQAFEPALFPDLSLPLSEIYRDVDLDEAGAAEA